MSSKQIPVELSKYTRLNRSTWYYQPEKSEKRSLSPSRSTTSTHALLSSSPTSPSGSNDEPSLILFCGWMAATPRHISKYTSGYTALYPHARILAVTTTPWDMFPIDAVSGGVARIQPVLDLLGGLQPHEHVLLHFVSNGGVMTSVFIAQAFRARTGRLLPVSAIVMDSAPGTAKWDCSVRAFAVGLGKNPIIVFLGHLLIFFLFGIYKIIFFLFSMRDGVEQGRLDLNDTSLFDVNVPRAYIYSERDDIVNWSDVEEHAAEAKDLGYRVYSDKFTQSGHASHLPSDGKRYWGTVQRLWERRLA